LLLAHAGPVGPVAWLAHVTRLQGVRHVSYCLDVVNCGVGLIGYILTAVRLIYVEAWEIIPTNRYAAVVSS
jgi:hypothetical protein